MIDTDPVHQWMSHVWKLSDGLRFRWDLHTGSYHVGHALADHLKRYARRHPGNPAHPWDPLAGQSIYALFGTPIVDNETLPPLGWQVRDEHDTVQHEGVYDPGAIA